LFHASGRTDKHDEARIHNRDEISVTHITSRRGKIGHAVFRIETVFEIDHLENRNLNWGMIVKLISYKAHVDMNWTVCE
jgi:hypothetical protein